MATLAYGRTVASDRRGFLEFFFGYALLVLTGGFSFQLSGVDPTMMTPDSPISPIGRINTAAVYICILLIAVMHRRSVQSVIISAWPVWLIPALALLSCQWAPDAGGTLEQVIAIVLIQLLLATMVATLPSLSVVRVVLTMLGASIFLSVLWVFLFPRYGVHTASDWVEPIHAGLWRGIYSHKNTLGHVSGLAIAYFVFFGKLAFRQRAIRIAAIVASAICLLKSGSGTGIILACIMIAAGLMFQVLLSLNTSMRLLFSSFGLVIILGLFAAAFPIAFILMEALGKSPDMTGRVPIWVALFVWAQERPWLGFGYSTGFKFEMVPRLTEYIGFAADHAHNGYLEIFIGLGYVGVAALVFVILSFLSRLMKSLTCNIENERVVIPFIGMIFFCALVTNISESSFFRKGELLGALWSLGYLMLSTYEKKDVLNGRVRNTRKLDVGA